MKAGHYNVQGTHGLTGRGKLGSSLVTKVTVRYRAQSLACNAHMVSSICKQQLGTTDACKPAVHGAQLHFGGGIQTCISQSTCNATNACSCPQDPVASKRHSVVGCRLTYHAPGLCSATSSTMVAIAPTSSSSSSLSSSKHRQLSPHVGGYLSRGGRPALATHAARTTE